MNVVRNELNINFIGNMRSFGIFSGVLVLLSILSMLTLGLNFGIDFVGGYEIQVKFPKAVSETEIREALAQAEVGDARVQRFGAESDNEYLILVRDHGTMGEDVKVRLKTDFEQLAGGASELINWAVAQSGETLTVGFSKAVDEASVRAIVEKQGLKIKGMTRGDREDRPEYSIELVSLADQIESSLRTKLSLGDDSELVGRVEFVGPQVGAQLRNQGFLAVLYALGFILLYIAVRFDLFFSPGAVIALVHDVIITMGVFSIFQLEVNLPIIAAILALVGYSLNDTIVVYDRIRENSIRLRGRDLRSLVNTSINQTMSRTLLTSGTTLLVVLALLFVGGGIIRDFSLALCVGIIVGTFSSIAIASPVYVLLRERYDSPEHASGKKASAAA